MTLVQELLSLCTDLLQRRQQFFVIRRLIQRIYLGERDFPLLVHDEHGTLGNAGKRRFFTQNPELL